MVNYIVLVAYCLLMAIFITMSALAIRHTMKFGYIDHSFKKLGWIFGFVALAVIIFTAYLMINLFNADRTGSPTPKTTKTDINY